MISSLAAARTREAMHNLWDKNDPKDAQVLLHLLAHGFTQHFHDPLVHNIHDMQELSLTYAQVSFEKTRVQHRLLTHHLPLYFPEIERYYHASRSLWLLELLHAFPTPGSITALSQEQFIERALPIVGRKIAKQRLLEDIYSRAQSSIGLPVRKDSEVVAMFRVTLGENSFRDKFERYIRRDPASADRKRMAYVQYSRRELRHRPQFSGLSLSEWIRTTLAAALER